MLDFPLTVGKYLYVSQNDSKTFGFLKKSTENPVAYLLMSCCSLSDATSSKKSILNAFNHVSC